MGRRDRRPARRWYACVGGEATVHKHRDSNPVPAPWRALAPESQAQLFAKGVFRLTRWRLWRLRSRRPGQCRATLHGLIFVVPLLLSTPDPSWKFRVILLWRLANGLLSSLPSCRGSLARRPRRRLQQDKAAVPGTHESNKEQPRMALGRAR